jgi:hypothetical protein
MSVRLCCLPALCVCAATLPALAQPTTSGRLPAAETPATAVWPLAEQSAGGFVEIGRLVGTEGGLAVVSGDGTVQRVLTATDGLPSAHVTVLAGRATYRSGPAQHTVWVGTTEGLARYDLSCVHETTTAGVRSCTEYAGTVHAAGLDGEHVSALAVRGDAVWGISGYGALWERTASGTIRGTGSGATDLAFSPGEDSLWVAVPEQGVERWVIDASDGRFRFDALFADPNVDLCLENTTALHVDVHGRLWATFFDYGYKDCSAEGDDDDELFRVASAGATNRPRRPRMAHYDGATWVGRPVLDTRQRPAGAAEAALGTDLTDITTWGSAVWVSARPSEDGDGGVAYSTDGGETWTVLQEGGGALPSNDVRALQPGPGGIHVATAAGAVWHAPAIVSVPRAIRPVDGAEDVAIRPRLEWEGVFGAERYEVQVATNPDFTDVVAAATTRHYWPGRLTVGLSLEPGMEYHWRVRGARDGVQGLWSETRTFRVGGRDWRLLTQVAVTALHVEAETGAAWIAWNIVGGRSSSNGLRAFSPHGEPVWAPRLFLSGGETPSTDRTNPIRVLIDAGPGRVWAVRGPIQPDFNGPTYWGDLLWLDRERQTQWAFFEGVEDASVRGDTLWALAGYVTNNPCPCYIFRIVTDPADGRPNEVSILTEDYRLVPLDELWEHGEPLEVHSRIIAVIPGGGFRLGRISCHPPFRSEEDCSTDDPVPPRTSRLVQLFENDPPPPFRLEDVRTHAFGPSDLWAFTLDGLWHGRAPYGPSDWTLHPLSEDNAPAAPVSALAVDGDGRPWVGTNGTGLAHHDGRRWAWFSTANATLPSDSVTSVAAHPGGGVWIGTESGAVYTTASSRPFLDAAGEAAPRVFALAAPYPNPARGPVAFTFELAAPGPATLAVYDLLGRRVAVVTDEELPAGAHRAVWEAPVAAGVYVARLSSADGQEARRFTVVR